MGFGVPDSVALMGTNGTNGNWGNINLSGSHGMQDRIAQKSAIIHNIIRLSGNNELRLQSTNGKNRARRFWVSSLRR